jgi:plastocyanin
MTSRLRWKIGAAAAVAVCMTPAGAQAATKTVFMGAAPPTASVAQMKAFESAGAEAMDFYPRSVTIRRGDLVSFEPRGFHTVEFPAAGGAPLGFLAPTDKKAGNVLDAAATPFWFSNIAPVLAFNPGLLPQGFGKLKIKGAGAIRSGLPLDEKVKAMRVKFPKAGSFKYFCNIHPGMTGTVKVVGKTARVPSAAADTRTAKIGIAGAVANAKKFPVTAGIPANTISVSQQKGTVHHFGFVPSKLTVAPGTTVTFSVPSNARDVHTASFGPGDPNKDPKKEPNNYMAKIASTFAGPGPFEPIATYPSEAPTAPTAALTSTLHGNGYWNSGVIGAPLTGLPQSAKVTFSTAGAYKFYCLIHPFMAGTITVQ